MENKAQFFKPKVLILGKLPPPYFGPAIATQILLNSGLNKKFYLIHLKTNINNSIAGIQTFRFSKLTDGLKLYLRMIKLVKAENPSLVLVPISQSSMGFIKDSIFILISRFYRKKVVIHLRGSNFLIWIRKSSIVNRIYVHFILKKTNGVIVLGHKLRYLFKNYFAEEKIFVVPNGANYTLFTGIKENTDKMKLLYLSNLHSSKGIDDFLIATNILHKEGIRLNISIVGDWWDDSTRERCIKFISDNLLPVTFHKVKGEEEKYSLLRKADIFIFPPRMPEGHPWVIIEAMAAGLPIISTDQGAITESVINGVNGFIVQQQNPQQIADNIKFLIEHPDIRIKMGCESRRLYLEKFTEDKMVERLTEVFNEVLEN